MACLTSLPSAYEWSGIQNNNNNEYYLSLADGSYNNNNKNNQYWVVPAESDGLCEQIFSAELDCWKNKHSSWDACKFHYNLGRKIWSLISDVSEGTYSPSQTYCFITLKPRPREIFASHYRDRVMHHFVAPYMISITEHVHISNNNMSYGNRKGTSVFLACKKLQMYMQEMGDGYIVSWDIKNFFMSIDREIAWNIFCDYESKYTPLGYSGNDRNRIMEIIHLLILHEPTENTHKCSPQQLWNSIKSEKSLFNTNGKGLPIGNFYSQIIANLILAIVCEVIKEYKILEFVDDFSGVFRTLNEVNECERLIKRACGVLHLTLHPSKKYIQPISHGINWCGYKIFKDCIRISDRTLLVCTKKIEYFLNTAPSMRKSKKLQSSINSYFGIFKHINEWDTQNRLRELIINSKYSKWLYFEEKETQIICKLKEEFKPVNISKNDILEIHNYQKQNKKKHD